MRADVLTLSVRQVSGAQRRSESSSKKEDVQMITSTIQYDAISTSHTASASLVRANTPLFSALSPVFVETPSLWDSTGAALPEHLHQKDNEGQRKRTGLECGPPFPPRES